MYSYQSLGPCSYNLDTLAILLSIPDELGMSCVQDVAVQRKLETKSTLIGSLESSSSANACSWGIFRHVRQRCQSWESGPARRFEADVAIPPPYLSSSL